MNLLILFLIFPTNKNILGRCGTKAEEKKLKREMKNVKFELCSECRKNGSAKKFKKCPKCGNTSAQIKLLKYWEHFDSVFSDPKKVEELSVEKASEMIKKLEKYAQTRKTEEIIYVLFHVLLPILFWGLICISSLGFGGYVIYKILIEILRIF